MKNLIMKRKGEPSWITWIKKRIKNNLNFLSITTGATGNGKSYIDLSIAYMLDKEFDAKEQVAFSFSEFMNIINKFNDKKTALSKRKYKVLVFDEVQVSVNKRQWQSKINKLFNFLVSTFRHQNIIVLFNSPYADFVDINTMKLIHAKFETKGWNKKTKLSGVRAKILQYNDKLSKFYEHSLYVISNGKVHKFEGIWKIPKPPKHICEPYEEMKRAFTQRLNLRITKEIAEMEGEAYGEPKKEVIKPKGELNPESIQPLLWEEAQKGYKTQQELAERLEKIRERKVHLGNLNKNIISMRKKGYDIRIYKEKQPIS